MDIEKRFHPELLPIVKSMPSGTTAFTSENLPSLRTPVPAPPEDPEISFREVQIPGPDGAPKISVKIFAPKSKTGASPAVLHLHGGGYAGGSTELFMGFIGRYVKEAGCVVVSPEYRLSPENPYPAGVEDCYATLKWLAANSAELGVDPKRIAVTGNSAGGGLTIAVCLLARDRGGPAVRFQMPLYPTMDDRLETPSSHEITDGRVLNRESCEGIWTFYLGEGHKEKEVPIYAAPSRAKDYSGLPPCYTFVGDLDPHRDETLDYITRLVQSGVPTGFALYSGCFHGFDLMAGHTGVARRAIDAAVQALIEGLA